MSSEEGEQQLRVDMGALGSAVLARWMRILIVTVLAVAATAGLLVFVPRTYESTARLIVEAGASATAVDTGARVASQVELLRSRDLLMQVVDTEQLRSEPELVKPGFSLFSALTGVLGSGEQPGVDEVVLANLAERTHVAREGGSSVISITVQAGNPGLAARIANALARTHVEGWAARQAADTAAATSRLEREIESLRGQVNAADAAVTSYKLEHGFTTNAIPLPPTEAVSATAQKIADAQLRKEDAQRRAEELRALLQSGGELGDVAELRDSLGTSALLQSLAALEAELTQKQTTLLPNHPTIKALRSQIGRLTSEVATEAAKVATALDAEAKSAAELEQRLRAEAARNDAAAGDAAVSSVNLEGLEREARTQRELLESYLAKHADLVAAASSNEARQDIRIISHAAPAREPASPSYWSLMGAVGLAAIALQVALLVANPGRPMRDETARDHDRLQASVSGPEALLEPTAESAVEQEPESPFEFESTPANPFHDDSGDLLAQAMERELMHTAGGDARQQSMESQMSDLSDFVGDHGIVMLVSVGEGEGKVHAIDRLLEDALLGQRSAVVVDAGSGLVSDTPGITDLAAGAIDYGDALRRIDDSFAEVKWGRLPTLDRHSRHPLTMVEALADIYHLVVVDTGHAGLASSLPLFTGVSATVVVIATEGASLASFAAAERDVAALGFEVGRIVEFAVPRAEVA